MAFVVLPGPDIALLADVAGTRLQLPQFDGEVPTTTPDVAGVTFYGDTLPTPYRGEGQPVEWDLVVGFTPSQQALAVALLYLLRTAHEAPDGRLQLRTAGASVAGLDQVVAITADRWTPTKVGGGAIDVAIHARQVAS